MRHYIFDFLYLIVWRGVVVGSAAGEEWSFTYFSSSWRGEHRLIGAAGMRGAGSGDLAKHLKV